MARLLSLTWLAFANEQGLDPMSHIQGVRSALAR
jgi:hypothetical protein